MLARDTTFAIIRRGPLRTSAFVLLLAATVTGAVATGIPLARAVAPGSLAALGRLFALACVVAGGAMLARNYHGLRRALLERANAEAEARTAALTDELTGVYNRRGFRALAEHQIRIARRNGTDLLLLYIDADNFKHVNDRYGHAAGDTALKELGALLRSTVRETDIVARLGGDEFVVLVVEADDATEAAVRGRLTRALTLRNARERSFPLGFSLGAAHLDDSRAASLDDLVAAADQALYESKRQRRPSYRR